MAFQSNVTDPSGGAHSEAYIQVMQASLDMESEEVRLVFYSCHDKAWRDAKKPPFQARGYSIALSAFDPAVVNIIKAEMYRVAKLKIPELANALNV